MKLLRTIFSLILIIGFFLPLQAQSGNKEVKMTITREANGVTQVIDTTFFVNDPSEVEAILKQMGLAEPGEGEALEKRIVIRDVEQPGPERVFEVESSGSKPLIGVYLNDNPDTKGFSFNFFGNDEDKTRGVYVSGLTSNSAAKEAGIQNGDIIISLDGTEVNTVADVSDVKRAYKPGDKMTIVFLREDQPQSTVVTLKGSEQKTVSSQTRHSVQVTENKTFLGVVPSTVDERDARRLDLPEARGVLIEEVVKGHSAEAAGLEENDVIIRMDGQQVDNNSDLREVLENHKPGDQIRIDFIRESRKRSVNVELGGKEQVTWRNVDADDVMKVEEKRAFLGVYLETDGDGEGVRITRVTKNTAAEAAGLQEDDIIIRIGSYDTPDYSSLVKALRKYEPGKRVPIRYIRDDRYESTTATMGEKTVTKWVTRDVIKTQAIDVEVIIKDFRNKDEAKELVEYMQSPSLAFSDFEVFPNPSDGEFALRFTPESRGPVSIKIYNFNGQVVYQEQLTDFTGTYKKKIDISDNASGTYFLQVTQGGNGMARKLVLQD